MSLQYYLGLDVSTQGTKLVLLDYENTKILFVSSVNYDADLPEFQTENGSIKDSDEGVSESDPEMWIKAIHLLFHRLKETGLDLSAIKAISVSGQQHGLVCLDKQGNLTRKTSKLWNDVSTFQECDKLTKTIGGDKKVIAQIFNSMRPGYTAGKIFHFKRNDPQSFKNTSTFFLVHNYINWFLTGGKNNGVRVMEPGDTSGMALWNPLKKNWSSPVCNAIDRNLISNLPPVKPATEFIGAVSDELVNQYGFSKDCKIDGGSGDNMMGAVGTGNVKPGIVTVSLGTSGTAFTIFKNPYFDPEGEIASFCDSFGNYMPLLCVSNLATGYNNILKQYNLNHDDFSSIIHNSLPGNSGKVILPWFSGERTPNLPFGTPLYFGFGLEDFTKEVLCRAVLEGHLMNLYEGFLKLPLKPRIIHLTGGLSKSGSWRQAIADIFNCEVIPVKGEGAALGAAVHAVYSDHKKEIKDVFSFVNGFVEFDEQNRTKPDSANVGEYKKFKKIYLALSQRIRGLTSKDDPFRERAAFLQ
jgi:xylulokinase